MPFPATQILDRVLDAPLPYHVSRALLCAHARLFEGLARGGKGTPWLEELCLLANQVIPRWKCAGLIKRGDELKWTASDDEEVKDAPIEVLAELYERLRKISTEGQVHKPGEESVNEQLWKKLLSERGVRHFCAWRVGPETGKDDSYLILVSDYQDGLKEHEVTAMTLIASIASLAVVQTGAVATEKRAGNREVETTAGNQRKSAPRAEAKSNSAPVSKPVPTVELKTTHAQNLPFQKMNGTASNGGGESTRSKTNVSEVERIERETFESLKVLAAGVAHDLNNILTALVGNVSLANMLISNIPEASTRLVEAERACFRAKDLAHQLLSFSKGSEPVKKASQLEEVVKRCTDFYLRESKSIPNLIAPEGLWSVCLDEGQISQAIENLITHADNMMPNGGIITLTCENVRYQKSTAKMFLPLEDGHYVALKVQDQGAPLPEQHLQHVFKPYVMNEEMGNGLRLASTYTIVKNHGGHIVATTTDQGNEMTMYLPATDSGKLNHSPKSDLKKSGRILIVDDEKSIRDLASTTLKLMGCQVVSCPSSSEGVNTFLEARQNGEPFDLIIMDLSIPGDLGGNEAMQQILKIAPDAQGIASSGYSDGSIMTHYREYGFRAALSKPYNITDLQRIVASMLHC